MSQRIGAVAFVLLLCVLGSALYHIFIYADPFLRAVLFIRDLLR